MFADLWRQPNVASTDEAELVGASFLDVHRREEGAALGGQRGLGRLGVVLPDSVSVAASLDDTPRGVGDVEAVFRVKNGVARNVLPGAWLVVSMFVAILRARNSPVSQQQAMLGVFSLMLPAPCRAPPSSSYLRSSFSAARWNSAATSTIEMFTYCSVVSAKTCPIIRWRIGSRTPLGHVGAEGAEARGFAFSSAGRSRRVRENLRESGARHRLPSLRALNHDEDRWSQAPGGSCRSPPRWAPQDGLQAWHIAAPQLPAWEARFRLPAW